MRRVTKSRRGYSIWLTGAAAYVVYYGRVRKNAVPQYVARGLDDAHDWVRRRIAALERRADRRRVLTSS